MAGRSTTSSTNCECWTQLWKQFNYVSTPQPPSWSPICSLFTIVAWRDAGWDQKNVPGRQPMKHLWKKSRWPASFSARVWQLHATRLASWWAQPLGLLWERCCFLLLFSISLILMCRSRHWEPRQYQHQRCLGWFQSDSYWLPWYIGRWGLSVWKLTLHLYCSSHGQCFRISKSSQACCRHSPLWQEQHCPGVHASFHDRHRIGIFWPQVFEANIRLLGSLLSAHLLMEDPNFPGLAPDWYLEDLLRFKKNDIIGTPIDNLNSTAWHMIWLSAFFLLSTRLTLASPFPGWTWGTVFLRSVSKSCFISQVLSSGWQNNHLHSWRRIPSFRILSSLPTSRRSYLWDLC